MVDGLVRRLAFLVVAGASLLAACAGPSSDGAPATTTATPTAPPVTTASTTASTTTPTTVDPGPPFQVSETSFPLVDRSRPTVSHGQEISPYRALTTLVWVPDAPGRLPLVVFAHGFQVGPAPYEALLEAWAARGWVVAAPEFPLTDAAVAGPNLDENDINQQPADLRFVADWLVSAADPLAPRIDPTEVAVAGHSDGGESALAAALAPVPAGGPRFVAVIAMSVQPVTTGAADFGPILVTQGDADTINPLSYGMAAYRLADPPKYLLLLHGGGHLPPLEAGSPWLPGIEAVTEAFLAVYVTRSAAPSAITAAAAGNGLLSLESSLSQG